MPGLVESLRRRRISQSTARTDRVNSQPVGQTRDFALIDDVTERDSPVPWKTLTIVFICTLSFRLYYVSQPENWWILHPEEISQTIEVAHSEVYGYGFRSYEFLSPPGEEERNLAEEQETELGMFSTRSFLVPRMFIAAFQLTEWTGFKHNPFLTGKRFHCLVCSFLPIVAYRFAHVLHRSSRLALICCILCALSPLLTIFGSHTLTDSFLSPLFFYFVSNVFEILLYGQFTRPFSASGSSSSPSTSTSDTVSREPKELKHGGLIFKDKLKYVSSCAGLGVVTYAYPEKFLILLCLMIPIGLCANGKCSSLTLKLVLWAEGLLVGIVLGGLEDWFTYGQMFTSLKQWLWFQINIFQSSLVFHPTIPATYCSSMFCHNLSSIVLCLVVILYLTGYKAFNKSLTCAESRPYISMCLSFLFIHLFLCLNKRKEMRFLNDSVFLLAILQGSALHFVLHQVETRLPSGKYKPIILKIIPATLTLLYACSSYRTLPSELEKVYSDWLFAKDAPSSHINSCLHYVSKQNDVTGVFLSERYVFTGGYALLHKDVPLLAKISQDYCEFSYDSRRSVPSKTPFTENNFTSLSILSRIADYIDGRNFKYLYKVVLEKLELNYAIVVSDETFLAAGFKMVFVSGNVRVFKRLKSRVPSWEDGWKEISMALPSGINVNYLENEAKWLLAVGNLPKAIQRLEQVLKSEPNRREACSLLAACYAKSGKHNSVKRVQNLCKQFKGYRRKLLNL